MQHKNIEKIALDNQYFRQVLFTNEHSQVVLMAIQPGEEIGKEVHNVDQILVFVQGTGRADVGGESHDVEPGDMVDVPSGTEHNFTNTGSEVLKLYTVYAPSEHKPGTIHKTKAEADAAEAGE